MQSFVYIFAPCVSYMIRKACMREGLDTVEPMFCGGVFMTRVGVGKRKIRLYIYLIV